MAAIALLSRRLSLPAYVRPGAVVMPGQVGVFPAVLIFFSGAASLIYEVVWIQRASLTVGASYQAAATLITVFLLGLSAGSALFGACSRHVGRPLLWCATIEALLALFGATYTQQFAMADAGFEQLFALAGDDAVRTLVLRPLLIMVLLLPPTLLMGGTLPLFCCRWLDRAMSRNSIGTLYAINTYGAGAGCVAAGFALLPLLGSAATSGIAAALNACAAIGFMGLAWVDPSTSRHGESGHLHRAAAARVVSTPETLVLSLLALLTGASAMLNEVVWIRLLASVVRNTVCTYTMAISAVLLGSASGALVTGTWFDGIHAQRVRYAWLAIILAMLALSVVAVLVLPVQIWWFLADADTSLLFALLLPAAALSGSAYVGITRTGITGQSGASVIVGRLNALNIAGGVLGASLGGFWLVPSLGLQQAGYLAVGMLVIASGIASLFCRRLGASPASNALVRRAQGLALTTAVVCTMFWLEPTVSLPGDLLANQGRVEALVEGTNSTLAVIAQGEDHALYLNQAWQGVAGRSHQMFAAHLPMLYVPNAQNVLVVGLGAGQAAGRFLQHSIKALDIVDIEPALPDFVRAHFPALWMTDSRVAVVTDDGRSFVQHAARQYDVMSLELGQPYLPGVDKFYTQEFYTLARSRLTPDGVIAQFVPATLLPGDELASVVKTFLTVFPHAALWYNSSELLLLGSVAPLPMLNERHFKNMLRNPQTASDMTYAYWGGARYQLREFPVLLGGFLANESQLQSLATAGGGRVLTNDDGHLAFAVSQVRSAHQLARHNAALLQRFLTPVDIAAVPGSLSSPQIEHAEQVRRLNLGDMAATARVDAISEDPGAIYDAVDQLRLALVDNPAAIRVLRMLVTGLMLAGRDAEALQYARQLVQVLPDSAWAKEQVLDLERRLGTP